ncbi:nucleoside recognition domain-containing protein [Cognatazoarcus halotolerans]|uniref:nucleoside recognition domain-containing protein n=1 Tax=Cognatazoarcus halotolerans TaxID=2686016 RepID=UPI00190F6A0D|nr:nucleoside recognition domain-containing protein [Cognatazoarcus halotolerans]MCB1901241.1 hypothetical protein [Rhodocyclaceae bacterium]MCP5307928.1 hypothetical protein [Zoogloeaceae bacterium]
MLPQPPRHPPLLAVLATFASEILAVYWSLLRLMVPTLLLVKALELGGATHWLAKALAPLMTLVGLPDVIGLVWAATLLTNIYTGLAVFSQLNGGLDLSGAQVTVLGCLMLVAHSLPVEAAVARAAGVSWRATLAIRLGGALALAASVNLVCRATGWLAAPAHFVDFGTGGNGTFADWALEQVQMLLMILLVIAALMALLRLLRRIGVERAIHRALSPVLRLIGIRGEATNIAVIGVTLGLTFGAGLLLREVRSGHLAHRDVFLTMAFLGLAHSLIEDTLLVMLTGADLVGILWARLAFALVAVAALARLPALTRRLAAASN